MQQSYLKYYEHISPIAPMRFLWDMRGKSDLQRRSLQNRQHDYRRLQDDDALRALHLELNRQLLAQEKGWESYDYGEGYFYQSSRQLGVTGFRDTEGRVEAMKLRERVAGKRVLEIGCNAGFLSLAIAEAADFIVGFELNPYQIAVAVAGAEHLHVDNVRFLISSFEDYPDDDQYDLVLSFANHHTYDGNTRQSLEEYFDRCLALTAPGGVLLFESHPPELEGDGLDHTIDLIGERFDIESREVLEYGGFLDKDRTFVVASKPGGAGGR